MKTIPNLQTNNFRRYPLPNLEAGPGGASPPPPPPSLASPPPPPSGGGEWFGGFDPDVKEFVTRNAFPDAGAMAKSAMHLEKLAGVPHDQLVRRPASDYATDPKPHMAALDVLGRPKEAKAYIEAGVFKLPQGAGEIDAAQQEATAKVFHEKAGLLPWQAKIVMEHFGEVGAAALTSQESAQAAIDSERAGRLDAFKAEMGGKFKPAIETMQAVLKQFDRPLSGDINDLKAKGLVRVDANGLVLMDANNNPIPKGEFEALAEETGLGNEPRFLRMFAALAERFAPSSLVNDGGRQLDQPGSMSKAQAAQREAQLRGDPNWMKQYTTRGDPGHAAAVEEMTRLSKIQHG